MRSRRTVVVLTLILAAAGVAAAIAAIKEPAPGGQEIVSRTFPFPWTVRVKDMPQGLVAEPGGHWQLKFDADVDLSRHDERYGVFTSLVVGVAAELRYDVAGAYRQGASSFAVTARFTTTGMPIERHDGWPRMRLVQGKGGSPFEAIYEYELPTSADRRHAFSGALDVALPEDTPPGHYEPKIYVFARVAGVKDPIHLAQYGENWAERVPPSLALVKIGQAADPHMPWTIMAKYRYRGQVGTLPLKDRKNVEICARSGFPAPFTVRPGIYDIAPSFPTIFPKESMPPVDGGLEVVPEAIPHHLRFDEGIVRGRVEGPDGTIKDLGEKPMEGQGETGPNLQGGPFRVDMSETGRYLIHLTGTITEDTGRSFTGGGTYVVYSAMPLSFSTSCKPGNSFLVGNRYPAKVNVNPPFPADVDVIVDYYPNSDASRKVHWEASGKANVFGHFVPYDKPMIEFTEPGEYVSYVTTRYIDSQGRLWMHSQTSSGVIAPEDGPLELHGTRTFPYDIQLYNKHYGGVKIFAGRPDVSSSFLSYTPAPMPDPYAPYDPRDTLYIAANGFNESLVEPHLTMTLRDTDLAKRLQKAYAHRSILIPPSIQPKVGRWHYLQDVVQVSTDSAAWFPADDENLDELPILPVGSDGWHPFAFPEKEEVEAYTYLGVIRPGFPAMTSVYQSDAIGLYWVASPNRFGQQLNTGPNGDLPGDMYRIQGGAVLKDKVTGQNYYDAYSAGIVVVPSQGNAASILPPGERTLVTANGRDHKLFLSQDTHDTLEVGESMGFGGIIFPVIPGAKLTWSVTKPSGDVVELPGRANRLGVVRSFGAIPVDEPGLYRVNVDVQWGEMHGDVPGTYDGSFWHSAVPADNPETLSTTFEGLTRVDPTTPLRIPLSWPADLRDVKINVGVLMPGRVLDQIEVKPEGSSWEYPFHPRQFGVQHSNFDVRDFATGEWELADTVVMQFFLEADGPNGKVFDSLRLILRDDTLYHYRAMMRHEEMIQHSKS